MGVYLSTPITTKESESGGNRHVAYGATSMQGWRTGMEDAHSVVLEESEATSFIGVFDGHGGKEVAVFCARHMWEELKKCDEFKAGNIPGAIKYAFLRMDELLRTHAGQRELRAILDEDRPERQPKGEDADSDMPIDSTPNSDSDAAPSHLLSAAGCTSVVAVIRADRLWVGNAGDSRAVLCRNGQAVAMSIDHKPNDTIEKQRIEHAGGFICHGRVNGNLNLSRAIGDLEFKTNKSLEPEKQVITANPDVTEETLTSNDEFLILACDGIWDVKSSQQAVDFVRQRIPTASPLSDLTEDLLDDCLAPDTAPPGLGCDNMTAVVVVFQRESQSSQDSQQPQQPQESPQSQESSQSQEISQSQESSQPQESSQSQESRQSQEPNEPQQS